MPSDDLQNDQQLVKQHYGAHTLAATACSTEALGCALPLQKSQLRPGEIVLDLGCGQGKEVLEAAKLVGPKGFVYGVDMVLEKLDLAEQSAVAGGTKNVCFIEGVMEDIPLPSHSVDVVTSNCVFNLSNNHSAAMAQVYRVLKPSGRLIIADIIALGSGVSHKTEQLIAPLLGCSNGVLSQEQYLGLLAECGFIDGAIEVYQRFELARISQRAKKRLATDALAALENSSFAKRVNGAFASVYVLARKPG